MGSIKTSIKFTNIDLKIDSIIKLMAHVAINCFLEVDTTISIGYMLKIKIIQLISH